MRSKVNFLVGPQEPLLASAKRRKLAWFGHVTRHDSLSETILHGTMEGGRRRGRKSKCLIDNIKERTYMPMPELLTRASCRKQKQKTKQKNGRRSLLNRPSCPPDDPIGQGTELNSTKLCIWPSQCLKAAKILRGKSVAPNGVFFVIQGNVESIPRSRDMYIMMKKERKKEIRSAESSWRACCTFGNCSETHGMSLEEQLKNLGRDTYRGD